MPSYSQVAKSVREQKEKHPENYCRVKDCLWRTATSPCQKHPIGDSVYELYHRLLKSIDMADLLDASGIPSTDAARMEDAQWEAVAKQAGHPGKVKPETRTVVLGLLVGCEAAVRRLQVATLGKFRTGVLECGHRGFSADGSGNGECGVCGKAEAHPIDEDPPCMCARQGDYEDARGCPAHDTL